MEIEKRDLFCVQNKVFQCEEAFQVLCRSKLLSHIFISIGMLQLYYTVLTFEIGCKHASMYTVKHGFEDTYATEHGRIMYVIMDVKM